MKLNDWIIEETADWIALNKPAGLLSIPDREGKDISLKKILQEKYNNPADPETAVFTVHRLDKDTSGVIVFAKNKIAHKELSLQFENRETEKIYFGLVIGSPTDKKATIDAPIAEHPVKKGLMVINRKGKSAITDYEVVEDFGIYSWLRFQIHTGRTHQIRVHMKNLGHPIVCDELYGDGKPIFISGLKKKFKLSKKEEAERPILNHQALHAFSLKFSFNKQIIFLEAPFPKDLKATLSQLEKRKQK
jgi:23S rRNA pseudouridine1911/1915/1917 synthase